jgi:hypothetical protein
MQICLPVLSFSSTLCHIYKSQNNQSNTSKMGQTDKQLARNTDLLTLLTLGAFPISQFDIDIT